MSDRIPPGAFPDAAKHLTRAVKRPDGGDVAAFTTQAVALAEMREAVNEHEDRLAALEAVAPSPFPHG